MRSNDAVGATKSGGDAARPDVRTAGFSLIELLVAIALIGLLVALLLPGLQHAREAAHRTECRNKLRQFGLALHEYHDVHGSLPPGYVYRSGPQGNHAGFSWGALCLPFLERSAVQKQFDWNVAIWDPANQKVREQHLPDFLCPSDAISSYSYVQMGSPPELYAMASYVANFGPPDLDADQEQRDGVFSRNSRTRLRDVSDGLSNTLFVGERENGPFRNGASHGNHFDYETTWCAAVRDAGDPTDDHGHMVLFQTGHPPNSPQSDDRDVSAAHVGIAHFLLGDGSVRPISENIELSAYVGLSTRAGREPVSDQ